MDRDRAAPGDTEGAIALDALRAGVVSHASLLRPACRELLFLCRDHAHETAARRTAGRWLEDNGLALDRKESQQCAHCKGMSDEHERTRSVPGTHQFL